MTTGRVGQPKILAIDAGGTMTDTFIINDQGEFVVGKAQTTPHDESIGFLNSARDALQYWNTTIEDTFGGMVSGIYSGTAMINRLLERKGRKVGIIVTAGMEDYLRLERGIQTYLGYSYSDRVHLATHRHNEPLVPRKRIFGVRERVDVFGKTAIPLYENEVRDAVKRLLEMGVDSIVVNLIYSFKNPAHETRIREIAEEMMGSNGHRRIPIYLSSELYPLRADFPRLNATLLEAYAAEPSREQLQMVRAKTHEVGAKFDLRVMASHGGTISIDARELARTMISGPIGGVIGAKYLAERIGTQNVACTDIGGTSFDIALITDGEYHIKNVPDVARFLLNIPLVQIDSVGAGTGSYVRINPGTQRIEIGPDSAGARIGMCYPQGDVNTVTISDCDVVLGLLNPDYFLGGDVKLDHQRALNAVKTQVADPLGMDVYDAAAGVVELFEDSLRNSLLGRIIGKGYGPENYTLLSYGGGGPLHVGGYSAGLHFEDVLIPSWAPGFSAFGCACGDFEYRYESSIDLPVMPGIDGETKVALGGAINAAWDKLAGKVADEFAKSGVDKEQITFKPAIRMQYYGQLNDLEFRSPVSRVEEPSDIDQLTNAFEELYAKIYHNAARTPDFGYLATRAIMTGSIAVEKPVLPQEALAGEEPPAAARKGERKVYWQGTWQAANIYELERLQAGNKISGPAIIEAPACTVVVPPQRSVRLDEHRIFHMV
jgi:N-methylhydantoinase A/acetone carboxylase beta subunit